MEVVGGVWVPTATMRGVISSVTVTCSGTRETSCPSMLVTSATTCWVPLRPAWITFRTPV